MTKYAFLIAGTALMTTTLFAAPGANAANPGDAASQRADQTFEKKRKCRTGYRYSRARMKCIKRQRRGSH